LEMGDAFAMPDEAIPTETARNMDAAYYAIEQAALLADANDDDEPILLPDTAMAIDPAPSQGRNAGLGVVGVITFGVVLATVLDSGVGRPPTS